MFALLGSISFIIGFFVKGNKRKSNKACHPWMQMGRSILEGLGMLMGRSILEKPGIQMGRSILEGPDGITDVCDSRGNPHS